MKEEDIIDTLAVIVAAAALVLNYWENRRMHQLTFFAEYTKRFQEIMVSMPFDAFSDDFDASKLNSDEQKKLATQMLIYFSLCSEEYDLFTDGYVKSRVWVVWEEGIITNLRKPAFVWGWNQVEKRFLFFPVFHRWVTQWLPPLSLSSSPSTQTTE